MNCRWLDEHHDIVIDFLFGEGGSEEEFHKLLEHTSACGFCRNELDEIARTVSILHTVPDSATPRIVYMLRSPSASSRWWGVLAASFFLIALTAGFLVGQKFQNTTSPTFARALTSQLPNVLVSNRQCEEYIDQKFARLQQTIQEQYDGLIRTFLQRVEANEASIMALRNNLLELQQQYVFFEKHTRKQLRSVIQQTSTRGQ